MAEARRRGDSRRAKAIALIVAAMALAPRVALAHQVGMSRGDYEVDARGIGARISLSRAELAGAVDGLDADRDGALTEAEIDAKKPEIAKLFANGLVVRAGGQPCPVTLAAASLEAPDGAAIELRADCASTTGVVTLDLGFVEALESGHRHVAHVGGGKKPFEDLVFRGKTHVEVEVAAPDVAPPSSNAIVSGLMRGLAGIDHLVFVAALVAFAGRVRAGAAIVLAYAMALAAGFALATSGAFVPSDRVLGPVVAATLVYAGLDALAVPAHAARSVRWIAVPFGVLHGLAYAVARGELGRATAPSFLVGVEIVVLGVAVVMLLATALTRRAAWFERWGTRAIAAPMAVAGLVWFVVRMARVG